MTDVPGLQPTSDCLRDDTLAQLVAGRLTVDERASADAHIDRCSRCRRLLLQLAQLSRVSHTRTTEPDPSLRREPERFEPVPGAKIGRCFVVRVLGMGAAGVVVAAYDPDLDRNVAIKLLSQPGTFRAEAVALARLQHPNVVSVYEIGSDRGHDYIVMELVEGQTASAWLAERPRRWREVLALFVAAGQGLAAIHEAGLVHRDVKPSNLLVGRDGRVRLGDLGLASAAPPEGEIAGTPAYMSPEQWRGSGIGPASDQFSFCAALFEALTGARPFGRIGVAGGPRAPWPRRSRIPGWLCAAVERGIAEDPAVRHAGMPALLEALTVDRRRRRARYVGALVLGCGVVVAALVWRARSTSDPPLCTGPAGEVAAVWGQAQRAQLSQAFAHSGRSHAPATSALVTRRLDDWTDDWQRSATAACQATRVTGEQSEALLDQRMLCYRHALAVVDETVRVLGDAPAAELVDRAVDMVSDLGSPAACAAVAQAGMRPAPAPGPRRDRIEGLERELARAIALESARRFQPALEIIERIRADALAVHEPDLEARLLFHAGRNLVRVERLADGEQALNDALRAAALAGDDTTAAEIWVNLIHVRGERHSPDAGPLLLVPFGDAALVRAGDPARLRARFEYTVAGVLLERSKAAEAIAHLERAIALDQRDPSAALAVAMDLSSLCGAYTFQGTLGAALPYCRRAVTAMETAVGGEHPANLQALSGLADVLRERGEHDESIAIAERGMRVQRAVYGEQFPLIDNALDSLTAAQLRAKDLVHACPGYQQLVDLFTQRLGADHPLTVLRLTFHAWCIKQVGDLTGARRELERAYAIQRQHAQEDLPFTSAELGDLACRRGDLATARVQLAASIAGFEGIGGPAYSELARPLGYLGDCERAAGHRDAAVVAYTRALALREVEPHDAADLHFGLAQALWPSEQARALDLARQAEDSFARAPPGFAADRARVSSWLAAHAAAATR